MMAKRVIRVDDNEVIVGNGRGGGKIQIPPFSYSGLPLANSYSPRWHPYVPLQIYWIQASSRIAGHAIFQVLRSSSGTVNERGDPTTDQVLATVQLDPVGAGEGSYGLTVLTERIDRQTLNTNEWIGIKCVANSSCEDVTITMIAHEIGITGFEMS